MHSFKQFNDLIESFFHHFDPEVLDKFFLKQWKAPHKLPMEFLENFHLFMFEATKNQKKFQYLMDKFEYCLTKSLCPKMNLKLKPRSTYFGDGVAQSQADTVLVTSDCPPSPRQTTPPPQSDAGEPANTSVELSYPHSPLALDICADLACNLACCHMDLLRQPSSLRFANPPDYIILWSFVPDSTLVVNGDQVVDRI